MSKTPKIGFIFWTCCRWRDFVLEAQQLLFTHLLCSVGNCWPYSIKTRVLFFFCSCKPIQQCVDENKWPKPSPARPAVCRLNSIQWENCLAAKSRVCLRAERWWSAWGHRHRKTKPRTRAGQRSYKNLVSDMIQFMWKENCSPESKTYFPKLCYANKMYEPHMVPCQSFAG